LKIAKLALVAAAAFTVTSHANATIFTVSTEGTVYSGIDRLGVFSNPGTKLDGLPYYLAFSFDLDATATHRDPLRYTQASGTAPFIVALTVGPYNYALEVTDNARESATITNAFSTNQGTIDAVQAGGTGTDSAGRPVRVDQNVWSYGIRSNSLTQYLQIGSSDFNYKAAFQIGNGPGSTGFSVYGPVTLTVNGAPATLPAPEPVPDPTPVPDPHSLPEPTSCMLFGAGLLSVVALRRRQSRR
jgi:hypothetical protein